jgi:hypothetical protein
VPAEPHGALFRVVLPVRDVERAAARVDDKDMST